MDELLVRLHACPQANAWTIERRRTWWTEHAQAAAQTTASTTRRIPTGADRTLKIDLGERRG
jgi:hypothetical protein